MTTTAELVQDAESQLLQLVRGDNVSGFSVTLVCANDKWIVSTTDNESGSYCIGEGPTFAEAWHARENQMFTRVRSQIKRAS
jgi:hypothetical protein